MIRDGTRLPGNVSFRKFRVASLHRFSRGSGYVVNHSTYTLCVPRPRAISWFDQRQPMFLVTCILHNSYSRRTNASLGRTSSIEKKYHPSSGNGIEFSSQRAGPRATFSGKSLEREWQFRPTTFNFPFYESRVQNPRLTARKLKYFLVCPLESINCRSTNFQVA